MSSAHDTSPNRATGLQKANRTPIMNDLEDVCRQAIAELRARGHQVRSLELTAWRDQKTEAGYFHVVSLPKIAAVQS